LWVIFLLQVLGFNDLGTLNKKWTIIVEDVKENNSFLFVLRRNWYILETSIWNTGRVETEKNPEEETSVSKVLHGSSSGFYWVWKTEDEGKMQIRTESEAHSEQWCQIYDTTVRELGTFCFASAKLLFFFSLCLWTLRLSSQTHLSRKLVPTKGHEWAHDLIIITVSFPSAESPYIPIINFIITPLFPTFFLFKITTHSL